MKKLFIYDIELVFMGTYTTKIFKKEKGVEATVPLNGNIVVDSKDSNYVIAIKLKKKYLEKFRKVIEDEGKIEFVDWAEPFFLFPEKEFNHIINALITDYNIREATVKEAIEILTPEEFSEIYGNVLKLGGKNNEI